jgi:hypothetical protein
MKDSLQSLHTFQHMLRVAKNQSNIKTIRRPKPKQEEPQQPIETPPSNKVDEQSIVVEEVKLITKSESKPKSENRLPNLGK